MPILDTLKSSLTDHLSTLITRMTLGSTGGDSSSKDGGAGNPQITVTPNVRRIDDRTLSISATFDTSLPFKKNEYNFVFLSCLVISARTFNISTIVISPFIH